MTEAAAGAGATQGQDGATGGAGSATPPLLDAANKGLAATQGQNGATEGAGGAAAGYWPEKAPETLAGFRKGSDRDTIDALLAELGKPSGVPEKADGYELKFDDDFTKRFGDLKSDDPALAVFREAAHKAGLPQDKFQSVIGSFYQALHEKGLLDAPDPAAEIEKLAPKTGDPATRKLEAYKRISTLDTGLKGLVNQGVITDADYKELQGNFSTAESFQALEKLVTRATGKEHGLQNGGAAAPGGGSFTRADLDAALNDPRYSTTSPTYSPAFRKEIDAKWEAARKNGSLS
ncbi:hypothetical protein JDN40_14350 [Rhodomicrobium vannielii ATCC 17100]|uniref:capsid assembly protein n=1 Tax=Rhodomicrobium vannielii TaxID=1069 RepID=UPI0019191B50|nr:hypothetical protein [Rhodomicrobium vannielii]MBJ7535289.1 hypothetical protein [Rhodomicrobium vannielii ATCC 17100]